MVDTTCHWQRIRLPAPVDDELMLCCLLGGEAVAPLGAPLSPLFAASDASLRRGAVVETRCSVEEVAWLWSRASHRGCYSHGLLASYMNPGGDSVPADEMLSNGREELVLASCWLTPFGGTSA